MLRNNLIDVQNPIFCNGANMAYRKEVFLEVNTFNKHNIVSGDDVFLLENRFFYLKTYFVTSKTFFH